ncbi:MAG: VOC family protein [Chloroflexota bacterium]|nr:VOC family protein [Chloroflexota bacterium]
MTTTTRLDPATRLGYVHLTISDMARSLMFYQLIVGLRLLLADGDNATLGAGDKPLLKLTERRGARRAPGTTGLFHLAILVPSRFDLSRSIYHLMEANIKVGGGDHGVSEAIYFDDPDGNGIEIYRDRPRDGWSYTDASIDMGTEALDFNGILSELGEAPPTWTGLHSRTMLGHVHLHVAHLDESEAFYRDVIGMDVMTRFGGSASFLSAGGYHHHVGINVWAGVGAPMPPPESVGLRYFTVRLADADERDRLIARLESAGAGYNLTTDGLIVRDPAGNTIRFV